MKEEIEDKMPRSSQSIDQFSDNYKRDVFKMLHAMGYDRSDAASIIKDNEAFIKRWAGNNPNSGAIATPQMVARMLIRDIENESRFL